MSAFLDAHRENGFSLVVLTRLYAFMTHLQPSAVVQIRVQVVHHPLKLQNVALSSSWRPLGTKKDHVLPADSP